MQPCRFEGNNNQLKELKTLMTFYVSKKTVRRASRTRLNKPAYKLRLDSSLNVFAKVERII